MRPTAARFRRTVSDSDTGSGWTGRAENVVADLAMPTVAVR